MINKIEIKTVSNELYDRLTDDFDDVIYEEHRRGSIFHKQIVQDITEEDCDLCNISKDYIGLWKSSVFLWSEVDYFNEDLFPFVRVIMEEVEVLVTKTIYKEVID
jgi:hypothetical protein